jgi:hypothetical protein
MRCSTVYKLDNGFIVHSESRNVQGLMSGSPPYKLLPLDVAPRELAKSVRAALEASRDAPPPPNYSDDRGKGVLILAGIKSWAKFKPCAMCCINADQRLVMTPQRRDGGGFSPLREAEFSILLDTNDERLGELLLRTLQRSETHF